MPVGSRRRFLTSSALGAIAAPWIGSKYVHAAGTDTIRLGLVGCGGRGLGATKQALATGRDVRLVAIGDVFESRIKSALPRLKQNPKSQVDLPPERVFLGFDAYQKVIDSDVDVVILTTPPGFRPLHFDAAVKAGKHVFMEKPLAVDAPGVRQVLAAAKIAKQKRLKVGVGFQHRHDPRCQQAVQRIQDGAIGDLTHSEAFYRTSGIWCRSRQRGQTEMEFQINNWFYFVWIGGGQNVEQNSHGIDVCHWIHGGPPASAVATGGRKERIGSDHGEVFDHLVVDYKFSDGVEMHSDCCHLSNIPKKVGVFVQGSSGTSDVYQGTITGAQAWQYSGPSNTAYQAEQDALFAAIREDTAFDEAEGGAISTLMAIMGRMAAYEKKEITWDAALNSQELYAPTRFAMNADPPTLPDKFGDYKVPARGRIIST